MGPSQRLGPTFEKKECPKKQIFQVILILIVRISVVVDGGESRIARNVRNMTFVIDAIVESVYMWLSTFISKARQTSLYVATVPKQMDGLEEKLKHRPLIMIVLYQAKNVGRKNESNVTGG